MTASSPALSGEQRRLAEANVGLAVRAVAAARRRLPRHADLDELTGEANLALVQAARKWRGQGSFAAYATVCIRNALIDAIASAVRSSCLPFDLDDAPVGDTAEAAIAAADYRRAAAGLTAPQRQSIELAAAGFAPAEQAALLQVPVNTVRQRMWRARRRLVPQLAV
jgi:RNA polymerase sigma factor (sigma-70 family)